MKTLIGFTGTKQHGKDTASTMLKLWLESKGYRVKIVALADPIRNIGEILGYTERQMKYDKNEINFVTGLSFREFAQKFGTDFCRDEINPSIWINLLTKALCRIEEDTIIIFPDVRFNNEAEMIRSGNGAVFKIHRGVNDNDTHKSESGISDELVDAQIDNDGGLHELFRMMETISVLIEKGAYDE